MPNTSRSSRQAARDRAALKRLRKSGIYKGKIDLRKAPTRYQLQKLEQLRAAKSRKSQPLPPRQKTPGATVKRTRISGKQLETLKPSAGHKLTTYALPFLRKGESEPEWRRFTHTGLAKFLYEYKTAQGDEEGAKEWRSYAVKEVWTFDTKAEVSGMRRDSNVFFSGVRIDGPSGKIQKRMSNKKGANYKGRKKRGKKR